MKLRGTSDLQEDIEEPISANQVEGLGRIYKATYVKRLLQLPTLLLSLTKGENHVHCRTFCSKVTLELGVDAFRQLSKTH